MTAQNTYTFGDDIPAKDRASARFMGQVHRALIYAAFYARERGMTIKSVAEESGLPREAVTKALSGAGNPTIRELAEILHAMGARVEITWEPLPPKPTDPDHPED